MQQFDDARAAYAAALERLEDDTTAFVAAAAVAHELGRAIDSEARLKDDD